ncbi:MAG: MarR family transcriptional regulator [Thermoproteota archaeon]|nr:MarR family transcriptional regulator [Thermoproteota archaeon]
MPNDTKNSPIHFIVLNAISKNFSKLDKIVKFAKLPRKEVETVIEELENQRLIIKTEKKAFLFGKKTQYSLAVTGTKMLNLKRQELEGQMRQIQQWYSQGDKAQLQTFMNNNRVWLPLMVFSGIMDMVFFMSIMSFVGISLNPMESSMAGENANSGPEATTEMQIHRDPILPKMEEMVEDLTAFRFF